MTTPFPTGRERIMMTPEGLALPLTLASRGARVGALAIDLAAVGVVMVLGFVGIFTMAGGLAGLHGGKSAPLEHAAQFLSILWLMALFLLRNGWFLYFELGPRGATPGKRAAGIRVAARDGGVLTAQMLLARNLLRDIELFLPASFLLSAWGGEDMGPAGMAATAWFLIFALFPWLNRDCLRAGDLIAGTWVVEAPKRKLEAALSLTQPTGYRFSEAELAVYGEYELQMLERVLRDADNRKGRGDSIAAVYATICAKIGREPIAHEERAFLTAYYTALRARLEGGMRFGRRKRNKFA